MINVFFSFFLILFVLSLKFFRIFIPFKPSQYSHKFFKIKITANLDYNGINELHFIFMCINRLTIFFYPNPPPVAVRNGENNLPTLECVTRVCNKNGDTKPLNISTIYFSNFAFQIIMMIITVIIIFIIVIFKVLITIYLLQVRPYK